MFIRFLFHFLFRFSTVLILWAFFCSCLCVLVWCVISFGSLKLCASLFSFEIYSLTYETLCDDDFTIFSIFHYLYNIGIEIDSMSFHSTQRSCALSVHRFIWFFFFIFFFLCIPFFLFLFLFSETFVQSSKENVNV